MLSPLSQPANNDPNIHKSLLKEISEWQGDSLAQAPVHHVQDRRTFGEAAQVLQYVRIIVRGVDGPEWCGPGSLGAYDCMKLNLPSLIWINRTGLLSGLWLALSKVNLAAVKTGRSLVFSIASRSFA